MERTVRINNFLDDDLGHEVVNQMCYEINDEVNVEVGGGVHDIIIDIGREVFKNISRIIY
jgi:hypothetical protein